MFGGEIQEPVKITVNVYSKDCLNRFVVKSEYATITIPEIELEIPKSTQKGSIKTIEGYLRATADGLKFNQEERRLQDPDTAMKLDEFIEKLERMCDGKDMPYHVVIDDPSGNSFVQNPHAPAKDVYVSTQHYKITKKDMKEMGFFNPDAPDDEEEEKEEEKKEKAKADFTPEEVEEMMALAKKRDQDYTPGGFDYTKSIDEQEKEIGNINNEAFVIPMPCYS